MRIVGHPHVVEPGAVGTVRPVDALHFSVDGYLRAGRGQFVPVRVAYGMLRHRCFRTVVDEGLTAMSHHHPLATKQYHIFLLEVHKLKVANSFAFEIMNLCAITRGAGVVG